MNIPNLVFMTQDNDKGYHIHNHLPGMIILYNINYYNLNIRFYDKS